MTCLAAAGESLSAGHDAAVYWKNDAGDEACLVRSEEQERLRRICRLTIAPERMHRVEGRKYGLHLLGLEERAVDWRLNHRRRDRIYANLVGSQLNRQIFDQCV